MIGQIALTAWLIVFVLPPLVYIFATPITPEWVQITIGMIIAVSLFTGIISSLVWVWA